MRYKFMRKTLVGLIFVFGGVMQAIPLLAEPATSTPAPLWYEVQINGESFTIESDRVNKVESRQKPGVTYNLAVRVAPTQQIRLDTFQFDYELPAKAEESGKPGSRTARVNHELGFSMLLNDLGQSLDSKSQQQALQLLLDSVAGTLREDKASDLDITEPHQRSFKASTARGATIRYRDSKGFGHVCLVYVLTGPKFGASCIVEYLENDADDAVPMIKKTLDSVRPIAAHR